jgi:Uma2 family endonuclease
VLTRRIHHLPLTTKTGIFAAKSHNMGTTHASIWQGPTTEHLLLRGASLFGRGLDIRPSRRLSEEEFWAFCAENDTLRIEQDKNGQLIIMPPVDINGGIAEDEAHGQLYIWRTQQGGGHSFSPTTGFKLLDGSTRSADGAWASAEKMAALPPSERGKFARLVPDFVIEVRSTTDRLGKLKKKMTDTWIANGVRLAWLIDPIAQRAYVYRPGQAPEEIRGFDRSLSGEDVCPGFELDLRKFL